MEQQATRGYLCLGQKLQRNKLLTVPMCISCRRIVGSAHSAALMKPEAARRPGGTYACPNYLPLGFHSATADPAPLPEPIA